MADERHLVEIDLLAQDEVEQQVERTLVDRGLDRVGHGDTIEALPAPPPRMPPGRWPGPATVAAVAPVAMPVTLAGGGGRCGAWSAGAWLQRHRRTPTVSPATAAQTLASVYKLSGSQQQCLERAFAAEPRRHPPAGQRRSGQRRRPGRPRPGRPGLHRRLDAGRRHRGRGRPGHGRAHRPPSRPASAQRGHRR